MTHTIRCEALRIDLLRVGPDAWEGTWNAGLTDAITVRWTRHPEVDEGRFTIEVRGEIGVSGESFEDSRDAWQDMKETVHRWSPDVLYRMLVSAEDRARAEALEQAKEEWP